MKSTRIVARRTRARIAVRVGSAGATPTGTVTVTVAGTTLRAVLRNGRVRLVLPRLATPRPTRVRVTYSGDTRTMSVTRAVQIRVVRP